MALIAITLTTHRLECKVDIRVIYVCSVRYPGIEVDDALGLRADGDLKQWTASAPVVMPARLPFNGSYEVLSPDERR